MRINRYYVLMLYFFSSANADLIVSGSLAGGLGNQLFISAAVYAYALDIGAEAIFPQYQVAHTGYSPVLSKLRRFEEQAPDLPVFWETGLTWTDLPRTHPQSICLAGLYQSANYFHHRRNEILALFSPSREILEYLQEKYRSILDRNTVSIHVRRGDYVHWRGGNGGTVMYNLSEDPDYYQRAIQQFDCENDYFLLFSDDMEFVKKMDILRHLKHYFLVEGQEHWEDFYLMTLCKHHIIANSTFSWWGAYLCQNPDQRVVFPWKWFGSGISSSEAVPGQYYRATSYTPMNHWIKIE